jgi:hypothetical protein
VGKEAHEAPSKKAKKDEEVTNQQTTVPHLPGARTRWAVRSAALDM